MALRTCRDCKSPVSTSAKSCPTCGAKPPKEGFGCTSTVFVFLILLGIGSIFDSTQDENGVENLAMSAPSQVCSAMDSLGMYGGDWKNRYEQEYGCSSPYKDIGNGKPIPNNIAFYAEGTSNKVTKVKLVLNLNDPKNSSSARAELLSAASLLTTKITNTEISPQIVNAINEEKAASQKIENSVISVQPIDWPTGGYEIQFAIIAMAKTNLSIAGGTGLNKILPPQKACSFLQAKGLTSEGWGELGGGEYGCPSVQKEFGIDTKTFYRNDIRYYVTSTNGKLSELKLFVNVNNPKDHTSAKKELLSTTQELLSNIGIKSIPAELTKGINDLQNTELSANGLNFYLVKMPWGTQGQFSIKLAIK